MTTDKKYLLILEPNGNQELDITDFVYPDGEVYYFLIDKPIDNDVNYIDIMEFYHYKKVSDNKYESLADYSEAIEEGEEEYIFDEILSNNEEFIKLAIEVFVSLGFKIAPIANGNVFFNSSLE